jgi:hypothetical protein
MNLRSVYAVQGAHYLSGRTATAGSTPTCAALVVCLAFLCARSS